MTATIKQEHAVQLQVKLEFGHNASCRKRPTPEGFTHDWKVFVRGPENKDISHFVDKVVFHLHESFPKPKRVFKDPPYRIEEHGYGSFNLPIDVYFKTKEEPKKVRIDYDLFLPAVGLPAIDNIRSEALKFINPPEEFKRKVLKAGGEIVEATNGVHSSPLISSNVNGNNSHHNMSINNGKDMRPEEDKPLTTANEPEKIEKIKKIKPVIKPSTKSQSLATKRPSNDEEGLHVKKKKKKLEESNTKATGFIPIEPPAAGVDEQDRVIESKDVKFKVKALPSKMSSKKSDKATDKLIEKMKEKKKEKTQDVSGTTNISINNNNSGKRRNSSSSKNKEKSSKSPQEGKTKSSKAEERKFEKITFRRESGDSWSSSTSNSPGLYSSVLGTSMSGKNNPLGTLMAELSDQDDDDDEDIDISTPFQAEASLQKSDSVFLTNNNLLDKKDDTKPIKSIKKKLKPTPVPKKQDSKNIPPSSFKKDVMKSPTNSVKTDPNKKASKHSPKSKSKESRNGHQVPPVDLIHLHKELSSMKDSSCLQQVVDILSHTGYFVITDTTLDFDLKELDVATIKQISSVLKDKASTCTTR